jgi:6-phosphogluconolactonase (cycloisomerase 2 family)
LIVRVSQLKMIIEPSLQCRATFTDPFRPLKHFMKPTLSLLLTSLLGTFLLSGSLAWAKIDVTPATLNFGTVVVGTSAVESVSVTGIGEASYTKVNVTITGSGSGCTVPKTPFWVKKGVTKSIDVTCTPTAVGSFSVTLSFNKPHTVVATGVGVSSSPTPTSTGLTPTPTPTPSPTPQTLIYAPRESGSLVSEFSVRPEGAMAAIGEAPANTAMAVAVHPTGNFAYAANNGGGNQGFVTQYTIAANGTLAPMTIPSVDAGISSTALVVHPNGKYVYVANQGNSVSKYAGTVSQYTVTADGSLSPMSTPTVAAGKNSLWIAIHPGGSFVYVVNSSSGNISQYDVAADGTLIPMANPTVPTASLPTAIAVHPSGLYAYVTSYGGGNGLTGAVLQYSVGTDGNLTPMLNPSIGAGVQPVALAVTPNGQYVYVANFGNATISQYSVNAAGSLSPLGIVYLAAGSSHEPDGIVVDPTGKFVYVADTAEDISQYSIGSNGTLTPLSTPTVCCGFAGLTTFLHQGH